MKQKVYIKIFPIIDMDEKTKLNLIKRNLQEIIGEKELPKILKKKEASVYWGTMPTGSPHVAYFLPLIKIRDFLKAGLKVKILIADLHAALDGVPWDILEKRQLYYEKLFPLMLKSLGVSTNKLHFIKGSKIQNNPKYFEDVLKISMICNINDCKKAASEVVKMTTNPKLGNLIYPIMQALDEEYLDVDAQFGGLDQRKILVFARENLPKIGYKPRIELMNPIIPGLIGEKMSSSISGSKIDILDDELEVNRKIRAAEFLGKNSNNGIMQMIKLIIFPLKEDEKQPFIIERPAKFGGDLAFPKYSDLEKALVAGKLHPLDIKNALAKEINKLLEPIRKNFDLKKLYKQAYC